MRRFWKPDDEELRALEGELRARRSEAPVGFVKMLADRARPEARSLRPSVRVSLAVALVTGALVAVASAGGFSVVKSTTSKSVKSVAHQIAHKTEKPKKDDDGPAHDQYEHHHKVTLCFHEHTITVDEKAAIVLLHKGATVGACKKHHGHGDDDKKHHGHGDDD